MIQSRVCCFVFKFLLLAIGLAAPVALAAETSSASSGAPAGSPNYKLNVRDQIEIVLFGEPDLTTTQRIDADGQVRLPHIGTVIITGKTVREAEDFVQKLYIEHKILKHPMATVRVVDYAVRDVAIFGEVARPGKLVFPTEVESLDIVDVIANCGGFTQMAKSSDVQVTRRKSDGTDEVFIVNVQAMIAPGRGRRPQERVLILPGDVIRVPQIIF